jgi:hypothetical protein
MTGVSDATVRLHCGAADLSSRAMVGDPSTLRKELRALPDRVYRRMVGEHDDPARAWLKESAQTPAAYRIARFGDCTWRLMPAAHSVHTEAGYPRLVAEAAAGRGKPIAFSDTFCLTFEDLPERADDVDTYYRLDQPPDLVLVHIGGIYGMQRVLPNGSRIDRIRHDLGVASERAIFQIYGWLLHPTLGAVGRPRYPYFGTARLDQFLSAARERWPDARQAVAGPHPVGVPGTFDPKVIARVNHEARIAASRAGAEYIDLVAAVAGLRRDAYCANGYNLAMAGHEAVAAVFDDWLRARVSATPPAPLEAAGTPSRSG